jgi:CDP-paratose 2-epimerase
MKNVLVTGSCGLIGSEAVKFYVSKGSRVVGIDNDMRLKFFHDEGASTKHMVKELESFDNYVHHSVDIRDEESISKIFKDNNFDLIIHAAAQPSHDWPAVDQIFEKDKTGLSKILDTSGPMTDFTINQMGTLVLLEATKKYCSDAVFIYTSTNKVYGDMPNKLLLLENDKRWELDKNHKYWDGIPEDMPLDINNPDDFYLKSLFTDLTPVVRSLFGVDKLGAESLVVEYGRNSELAGGKVLKTVVFRGGCLTGPAHAGTRLHGFLAYLVKCIYSGEKYVVNGYKGKQVRDNLHASDVLNVFDAFANNPRSGEIYNLGGGRYSNISMMESIEWIENYFDKKGNIEFSDVNRKGDHIWYVSDMSKFKKHYPHWNYEYDIDMILTEICEVVKNE